MANISFRVRSVLAQMDVVLSNGRKWNILLFSLAFVLKAIYVIQSADGLQTLSPIMDSRYYDNMAQHIAAGHAVQDEAFFMGPLYPYFLSIIYSILGRDFLVVRLLQSVGSALAVVLTFMIGKTVFRPTTAMLGALLLCFYGAATFYDTQMLMAWMGTLLNVSALLVLVRSTEESGWKRFAVAGALIGLSALARASILSFVPVVLLWMVKLRRGGTLHSRRLKAGAFVVAVLVMLLPATVHNFVASRDLVLVTSNAGVNFYIGNHATATGIFYPVAGLDFDRDPTTRSQVELKLGRDMKPSQVSRYWFGMALADMRADVVGSVRLMLRKFTMFFNGYEIPQIESYDINRNQYGMLRFLFVGFWWISALGITGAIFAIRDWRKHFLLGGYVLAYAITISAFFVTARYRVQIAPVMCLFAAFALVEVMPAKLPTPRGAGAFFLIFATLMLLLQPGAFALPENEIMFREHIHAGRRLSSIGRNKDAIAEIDQAVALFPNLAEGYIHRAIIDKADGNQLKAIEDYQRALRCDPDQPSVHYDLAQTLRGLRMTEEAIKDYRMAIELNPLMLQAHNNLGICLRDIGKNEEAIAAFRRVIELDPSYVKAYNNLGSCLAESGRVSEAIDVFQKAVDVNPAYQNSYRNLAMALISLKRVGPAIEALQSYLRLNPGDEQAQEVLRKLFVALNADSTAAPQR